ALGAHRTRLGSLGMLFAGFADNFFDVELLALACIEFLDADLDLSAKFAQRLDMLEQLAPKLLLRRLGKRCRFQHCQFECLDHVDSIPESWPGALALCGSGRGSCAGCLRPAESVPLGS